MHRNIILNDSILTVFDGLVKPAWLEGMDSFTVREVGGLHNLTKHDKERWLGAEGDPLRIVERITGREEIWFSTRKGHPRFISLDKEGRLQSHMKFSNIWVPAIHYGEGNIQSENRAAPGTNPYTHHETMLNIWCVDGEIHCFPDRLKGRSGLSHSHCGLEATRMMFAPRDPTADYIQGFHFDQINESWNEGEWEASKFTNMRIIFFKKKLNDPEIQDKMMAWLNKNCKHGFFPFGERLFADEEEEFLFIADFCT